MPGRNRIGPDGVGPLTGRSFGRGRGLGFRRGLGPDNEINFPDTPGKDDLENEITILKQRLAELDRQLSKTKKDD